MVLAAKQGTGASTLHLSVEDPVPQAHKNGDRKQREDEREDGVGPGDGGNRCYLHVIGREGCRHVIVRPGWTFRHELGGFNAVVGDGLAQLTFERIALGCQRLDVVVLNLRVILVVGQIDDRVDGLLNPRKEEVAPNPCHQKDRDHAPPRRPPPFLLLGAAFDAFGAPAGVLI